ncbi:MAG: DUF4114 domain-containing protein, partial [Cyanobacteria bacterium P01_C01_bin.147]
AGDDTITARGTNQTLLTGDGNDIVSIGSGTVDAGDGNNFVAASDGSLVVTAGSGDDTVNLVQGNLAATLGEGDNHVTSGAGDDSIITGAGDDFVHAGAGTNTLILGEGDNTVNTIAAQNAFLASIGQTTVITGSGSDTFIVGAGEGVVTIANFDESDRFELVGFKLDFSGAIGFSDVTIAQAGADTVITLTGTEDVLAVLQNTQADTVNAANFGESQTPTDPDADLLDLLDQTGPVQVDILDPQSEALFSNTVGFYQIEDASGTVIDPVTGALLQPGEAGYSEAAVARSQVDGHGLSFAIRDAEAITASLEGGTLYAPLIVSNGTIEDALSGSTHVFFEFAAANPQGIDHVQKSGNTYFFEDLFGGGDLDFNDAVFTVEIV